MDDHLKTTPLNSWHRNHQANMANFGGFDMPLWYKTGVKNEHLCVLTSAGLFDTSHMACVRVAGAGAVKLLQYCHTREITSLSEGRCIYGAVLNSKGHVIDDAIVYKFNKTDFMVCVNAGMGKCIADHLIRHRGDLDVTVKDLSGKLAKIDLQGKASAKILSRIIHRPEAVFSLFPYFSFKGHFDADRASRVKLLDNTPLLLSRSGYTGEFGFEIFLSTGRVASLWEEILDAGKPFGVIPCGLGARDSLRTGALLPLSHQDIGGWKFIHHPWEFALPFNPDKKGFTKKFIGSDALLDQEGAHFTHAFVGENLRKVGTGRQSSVLDSEGTTIGWVLSCATDMGIGWHGNTILSVATPHLPDSFKAKGISCGFVLVNRRLNEGDKLTLQEKKRSLTVTVVADIRPDRTARKKLETFL